jgi:hypothetical protein
MICRSLSFGYTKSSGNSCISQFIREIAAQSLNVFFFLGHSLRSISPIDADRYGRIAHDIMHFDMHVLVAFQQERASYQLVN